MEPNRYLPEWMKKILPGDLSTVDWTPVWLHGFIAFLVYSVVNLGVGAVQDVWGIDLPPFIAIASTVGVGFGRELYTGWRKNRVMWFGDWSLRKNWEWVIFAVVAVIMEIQV